MKYSNPPTPYRYSFKESAFHQVESLKTKHGPSVIVEFTKFLNQITTDFASGGDSDSILFSDLVDDSLAKASTHLQADALRACFYQLKTARDVENLRIKPGVIVDVYDGKTAFLVAAVFEVDHANQFIVFVDFIGISNSVFQV